MTDMRAVLQWMAGEDTGMSSKAIATHMAGVGSDGSYPHDPADLGRCLRLLERFPEWKARMPEMASYGKIWRTYADNWSDLEKSMADEVGIDWSKGREARKTYALMRSYQAEAK